MSLVYLQISNIRNLKNVCIEPSARLNIIVGENASGKTSLLESIFLLARGKSQRTRHLKDVVSMGENELVVFGRLDNRSTKREIPIGVRYRLGETIALRVDGQKVTRASDLATSFPLTSVASDSARLLTDGPRPRRQFLDWGVFHVEHAFFSAWQRYSRALKQRNAALKQASKLEVALWNNELSETSCTIDLFRKTYIQEIRPIFSRYLRIVLENLSSIEIRYYRGWNNDVEALGALLTESYESDKEAGHTQRGPHRADISIELNGKSVNHYSSAGQLKLIVSMLYLAQLAYFNEKTHRTGTILVDDLPAELDQHHRKKFIELLVNLNAQVFVTTTDRDLVDIGPARNLKMFHVKQGEVTEMC